jgi:hypothetical protein
LRYYNIIKEKLKERDADYKVLYAFSDFVHPETNESISEHAVNELKKKELIEDRFESEDYCLMVVANKFQTGFDQPLLAGMFLDKPVVDKRVVDWVGSHLGPLPGQANLGVNLIRKLADLDLIPEPTPKGALWDALLPGDLKHKNINKNKNLCNTKKKMIIE